MLAISDLLTLTGASLLHGEPSVRMAGVTTDTRDAGIRGKLYVALKGERSDGHDFTEKAAACGAAAAMLEKRAAEAARKICDTHPSFSVVLVPDTLAALGELARLYRRRLKAKIVAITGSNGKTSTKDFTASILSTTYHTVSAVKSFNNSIGVPLTILRMTPETQVGVLEMGMNHPGELTGLCRIADPDLVAITSIAPAHIGFFRSVRRVALAKSEILTASRADIPAFLPADSPFLPMLRRKAKGKRISTFGTAPEADWRVKALDMDMRRMTFSVLTREFVETIGVRPPRVRAVRLTCPNIGGHQLTNLLMAIAVANQFSVALPKIRSAVSGIQLPSGRGIIQRRGKHVVIDDSYNANPVSMSAALRRAHELWKMLNRRPSGRYEIALVLGDMLELGSASAKYHRELGRAVARIRPRRLIFIGGMGRHVMKGFLERGGAAGRIEIFETTEKSTGEVQRIMDAARRAVWLFKSSRQIGLERILTRPCQ